MKSFFFGLFFFFTVFPACQAQSWDLDLLYSIQNTRTPSLDKGMSFLSKSSYVIVLAVPVAELATGYFSHNPQLIRNALVTTAGTLITTGLVFGLKNTIQRDRPFLTHPSIIPYQWKGGYSFPSGHAGYSFGIASMLCFQYPKAYVIAPALIWATSVSYSRIHLGVHYPSDVLAGALIGVGSSYLSFKANQWLKNSTKEKRVFPENGFLQ